MTSDVFLRYRVPAEVSSRFAAAEAGCHAPSAGSHPEAGEVSAATRWLLDTVATPR